MKKVLSVLAGSVLLFGSVGYAFASVPIEYQIGIQPDSGPNYTQNVDAPSLPSTYGGVFGIDPTTGDVKFLSIGSNSGLLDTGTGITVSNIIADKIIIPDGDPLGYWFTNVLPTDYTSSTTFNGLNSTVSSLSSSLSALSASSGLSLNGIKAFMSDQATTSQLIATSTYNGFMSSAMVTKLNSLSATTSLAYEGTTARLNSFPIFKSATVGSGVAVFNLTADGTSGGTALCTNGVIQDSVNAVANDATASYQWSYAFSNSNKTVTITVNKLTTANILTGLLGQSAANGAVVKMSVYCY